MFRLIPGLRGLAIRGIGHLGTKSYSNLAFRIKPVHQHPVQFVEHRNSFLSFINTDNVFQTNNVISSPAQEDEEFNPNTMNLDSVLRKRRLKMKKHKLRKRRRAQRALKKRLGKL